MPVTNFGVGLDNDPMTHTVDNQVRHAFRHVDLDFLCGIVEKSCCKLVLLEFKCAFANAAERNAK